MTRCDHCDRPTATIPVGDEVLCDQCARHMYDALIPPLATVPTPELSPWEELMELGLAPDEALHRAGWWRRARQSWILGGN